MSFLDTHLLSLVVFLPLLVAGLVAFLPAKEHGPLRLITLLGMGAGSLLGLLAYLRFEPGGAEFQLEHRVRWLDAVGLSYHVGVDGLAASMVLLTALLGPVVVLASWRMVKERVKEFHLALLLLQCTTLGALVSLDVLLFYIFFEAMLLPTALMVGVWGGERRQQASLRFILATFGGSVLMLVALLGLYFVAQPAGERTFDYATLYNALVSAHRELGACRADVAACDALSPLAQSLREWGPWMFGAFVLAFAVKSPLFPVHRWLPETQSEAPVAVSVLLAVKVGAFGFWRFAFPLFPVATEQFRTALAVVAVISIVYGALMCLVQRDVRRFVAYATVSHLGTVLLGMLSMTPEGATGSAYHMLNQGVSTAALFILLGMLHERRGSKLMSDFGGLARVMPRFATVFLIVTFSFIAVPGTSGFVGEFLVLLGTFKSGLGMAVGVLAATGVILGAAYMLWMVQKVFFGPVTQPENHGLKDLSGRELAIALPFVALVLVMGLRPQPFLERLTPASQRFVARANVGLPEGAAPKAQEALVRVDALPLPPLAEGRPVLAQPAAPV
ncbi:MAG: NADH-quinone oxidoreductase subunit M, partial [Myxococcaceae bacterium]|nr:NADH-quinone oxidoreductase subunit M [Myxococcaceae bacterium]